MDDREAKLPKWAQDKLLALRRRVDEQGELIRTLRGKSPEGPIRVGGVARAMMGESEEIYMPGTDVEITWGGVKLKAICRSTPSEELALMTEPLDYRTHTSVGIQPIASNHFSLAPIRREGE
jgi:hypothetical protein